MFCCCSPDETIPCSICSSTIKKYSTSAHRKYSLACILISFLLEVNPEHEAIEKLREICKNNDGRGNSASTNESLYFIEKLKPETRREFKEYRRIIYHFG